MLGLPWSLSPCTQTGLRRTAHNCSYYQRSMRLPSRHISPHPHVVSTDRVAPPTLPHIPTFPQSHLPTQPRARQSLQVTPQGPAQVTWRRGGCVEDGRRKRRVEGASRRRVKCVTRLLRPKHRRQSKQCPDATHLTRHISTPACTGAAKSQSCSLPQLPQLPQFPTNFPKFPNSPFPQPPPPPAVDSPGLLLDVNETV